MSYTRSEIQLILRNRPRRDTSLRTNESNHPLALPYLPLSPCLNFRSLLQLNPLKICFFSLPSAILPSLSSSFTNKTINLWYLLLNIFPHQFSHLHLHLNCIYPPPRLPLWPPCLNPLHPHPLRPSNCRDQSRRVNSAIGTASLPVMRQSSTCSSSYLEIVVLRSWGEKNGMVLEHSRSLPGTASYQSTESFLQTS